LTRSEANPPPANDKQGQTTASALFLCDEVTRAKHERCCPAGILGFLTIIKGRGKRNERNFLHEILFSSSGKILDYSLKKCYNKKLSYVKMKKLFASKFAPRGRVHA